MHDTDFTSFMCFRMVYDAKINVKQIMIIWLKVHIPGSIPT